MATYWTMILSLTTIQLLLLALFDIVTDWMEVHLSQILQVSNCYLQLIIIVGLCLDGGRSATSRLLRCSAMQFLGKISFAMYLCHMPVLLQFSIALSEQAANSIEYFDDVTYFNFAYNYPWKILPVYLFVTVVCVCVCQRQTGISVSYRKYRFQGS